MRLFVLTAITMVAFAANSVFNRVAVDSGAIDAGPFAVIRVFSGAIVLVLLTVLMGGKMTFLIPRRMFGAGALTLYMVGFSAAYATLDAGVGALLAFGAVQIAIFAISAARGHPATGRQVAGSVVAFAGLAWVLWPTGQAVVDPFGAVFMLLAGLGWGVYTLTGREEPDPVAGSAANFCAALPLTALVVWLLGQWGAVSGVGIAWAIVSGAVTSGLFYALWYNLVPQMQPATAAISMLSVPVIALGAGVIVLGESAGLRLLSGTCVVLGGIAFAVWVPRRV